MNRWFALGLVVLTTACGSPAAPTPGAPATGTLTTSPAVTVALSGVWTGYLSATDCVVGFPCSSQRIVPFVLRIGSPGSQVAAALEVTDTSNGVVMDVSGVLQQDGSVLFTGHRGELDSDQANIELRRLIVRLDSTTGLSGDIDLRRFYSNGGHNRVLEGRILSAAYQPFTAVVAQGLSGTWSGRAVIRGCSGYCPGYQAVGDDLELSVSLGQAGSALTGQFLASNSLCFGCWLPVTGTAASASLSLTSERRSFSGGQGRTYQLQNFEGSLDHLGRIAGRFVVQGDSQIAVSPFAVSYRLECEVLWLKRD